VYVGCVQWLLPIASELEFPRLVSGSDRRLGDTAQLRPVEPALLMWILPNASCKPVGVTDTSECFVAGRGVLSQGINEWLPCPSEPQLSPPVLSLPWLRRAFGPLLSGETACGLQCL